MPERRLLRSARPPRAARRRQSLAALAIALLASLGGVSPAAGVPAVPVDPSVTGIAPGLLAEAAGGWVGDARPFATVAAASRPTATRTTTGAPGYRGRNHVWSPQLGLDDRVVWFPCSRSRAPDMATYRWGCAGNGNVYLMAHASGPFRRLHDVYVSGRLRKGMPVVYADPDGRVQRFLVAYWRVVLPTAGDWAWAPQARSSMTLQTCVGPASRYRLIVRLYEAD